MPNTLAHFGIQAILTRFAIPTADPKVVFLGCMLPDVPWIIQRLVLGLLPDLNPYSVRLYVIVQASLFMTLILCGALAILSKTPVQVFSILATGSLMHLFLDALQIKWGNGVHFFAPISWELLNFALFWPEDLSTYVLTGLGLGVFLWSWKHAISIPPNFASWSLRNLGLCLTIVVLYFVLPLAFLNGPYDQDNHYVKTLLQKDRRPDQPVEFDRTYYEKRSKGAVVYAYGEELLVSPHLLDHSATVSLQGRFLSPGHIAVSSLHEHTPWFRDGSSYLGLSLLCLMWGVALFRHYR